MTSKCSFVIAALLCFMSASFAQAVSPTAAEMTEARSWAAAKFEGVRNTKAPDVGLFVIANHSSVQLNGRFNKLLRINDKLYTQGLFCHAPSKLIVRLPSAGKTFTATTGVDSNEQTASGQGSVVFSVGIDKKIAFKSKLMREGMPGVPVQVDLQDAKQFTLEVGDGGDGIACDQADWADAKVVLANGQTILLGDLPIYGANYQPYDVEPFFSFTYDGKPSAELLKTWKLERSTQKLDDNRIQYTLTYTDPKTGLVVRCVGVEYSDFPTVEWTLYFKNTGTADTPIIADIQTVDTSFVREGDAEFTLHHIKGDFCAPDSFQPLTEKLGPKTSKSIASAGGRPTSVTNPYWNFKTQGKGVIVVLGWPGQWAARFDCDNAKALRIRAGQELTHFKLLPGEEVRSPMVVLQFYRGDWLRGQNIWRRWMIAHNMPRPSGKLPKAQHAACSSHQFSEMCAATTKDQLYFIDRYIEEGMKPDYWWMDAGWYPCDQIGWWKTGTWEVDTRRFPKGLREVSDHAHKKDIEIIVWHEPERVLGDTWLTKNHPEWVIGGKDGGLLNLGNPDVWKWTTQHFNKLIDDNGIDLYRQDFNFDPLNSWRSADAPDRQGITEIKHVTGYLAFWDDLIKRHPNMLLDSCASGGRRNDLETLRRSVPLYRSDYILEPIGNQGHTYGMSLWIPYYGTAGKAVDPYVLRSTTAASAIVTLFDMRVKDQNYDLLRRELSQWRQIAPDYMGDYYPLTPYSLDATAWIAWQFNRPEEGEGVIQAFRRPDSVYESIRVRLQGLNPNAIYTLTNFDIPGKTQATGSELMNDGLSVPIKTQPGSAVIKYKKNG